MTISAEAIAEFQDLCERHFGYRPSKAQAEKEGLKLLRLVTLVQPKQNIKLKDQINTSKINVNKL